MLKLYGEKVKHKIFGEGKITEFDNSYITVLFDNNEEKKFSYPIAFGTYLQMENKSLLNEIEEEKRIIIEKKEEEYKKSLEENARLAEEAEILRHTSKKTSKNSASSNIAFKCNYCDGGSSEENIGYTSACSDKVMKYNVSEAKHIWCNNSDAPCYKYCKGELSKDELMNKSNDNDFICYESQMLKNWRAYAGIAQTGINKGKPMKLKHIGRNSLALLTTRLPNASDDERFIFAVFLVDRNYEGDETEEGYVEANPKYKIKLSLKEAKKLKFWNYYFNPNKPEKIILGSGLHRYFDDIQSAQVLRDLCKIKENTVDELKCREFFEHYCKIKRIDIEDIPMPNGALVRIRNSNEENK